MEQRHIKCQDAECSICLEDAERLASSLEDRMVGLCDDHLAEYRVFLEEHHIPAVTVYGWFSAQAFEEKNLNLFAVNFERPPKELQEIRVVFDGPPAHESGRFIEVELPDGRSISIGEWHQREDDLWELRIPDVLFHPLPTNL